MVKKFYRYYIENYASIGLDGDFHVPTIPNPTVRFHEYDLYKETDKGYWIKYHCFNVNKIRRDCKWVSKTSRKRFAYPTKEEALMSFIIRQERRIAILEYNMENCISAVDKARKMMDKIKNGIDD